MTGTRAPSDQSTWLVRVVGRMLLAGGVLTLLVLFLTGIEPTSPNAVQGPSLPQIRGGSAFLMGFLGALQLFFGTWLLVATALRRAREG